MILTEGYRKNMGTTSIGTKTWRITNFKFLLLLLFFQLNTNSYAQDAGRTLGEIRGTVSNKKGEPLQGASIFIAGTNKGATTNIDGSFTLSVPNSGNVVLEVSNVGFQTKTVSVGKQKEINITLDEVVGGLDEVVVVGYGTQTKRNVTGSVSKVDMSKTATLPNTNVSEALRGTVAGVQVTDNGRPGQSGSILIRGPRSLSASNDPLVVLDGIIFSGSLADINPNDILSLEVLKDASAAAIYGSRAANGVILVTSKKGTSERPVIALNAFTGVSDWAYKVKLFSPERYVQSKLDYRAQSGLEADPAKILSYLNKSEAENYEKGISHDPWQEASQPGRISSYSLSLSGRSQYTNYFISGSVVDEKGLIFNDNQKRTSVRVNIDSKVSDWLSVGLNSVFAHRDLSGVNADLSNAYTNSPWGNWYYDDGEPTQFIVAEDQAYGNSVRASILTTNEEMYDNVFSNFYAKVNIPSLKGLAYRINYSPNYRWNHNYNFFRQDKHLTNNTTYAEKFDQKNFDWTLENILTYTKRFGANHNIDITLLYGRNHYGFESTTARGDQLSSDALGFNNLSLGSIFTAASYAEASEGISSMFRLNYAFKNKYLLTLTARRDGSSVFAANQKYATFPSASLAWIVSDESFIDKLKFIQMLKLRASYGSVGNQAISPYQSLSLSTTTQYVYGDGGSTVLGVYPSSMANADLKWETTNTSNVAVDFDLFKGKLGGTIEFYNSSTSNLLVKRSIPVTTGYNSIFTNIGNTNNKGIEISLNSINLKTTRFEWSTNFAFSTNKNKIVHLYHTDTNGDKKEDDDLSNRWFIGYPITTYFDYVYDGIYQEGDQIPSGSKPGFVRLKDLKR